VARVLSASFWGHTPKNSNPLSGAGPPKVRAAGQFNCDLLITNTDTIGKPL
jgi:hypothetical protein